MIIETIEGSKLCVRRIEQTFEYTGLECTGSNPIAVYVKEKNLIKDGSTYAQHQAYHSIRIGYRQYY